MGRTVPSYRMAIEAEIRDWKHFSTSLRQADKAPFEELMTVCRHYASSASAACRPLLSEAVFMSILLYHQKLISELKFQIEQLKNEKTTSTHAVRLEVPPIAVQAQG